MKASFLAAAAAVMLANTREKESKLSSNLEDPEGSLEDFEVERNIKGESIAAHGDSIQKRRPSWLRKCWMMHASVVASMYSNSSSIEDGISKPLASASETLNLAAIPHTLRDDATNPRDRSFAVFGGLKGFRPIRNRSRVRSFSLLGVLEGFRLTPKRSPDEGGTDFPRRFGRDALKKTLQIWLCFGEQEQSDKWSSQEKEDGNNDGPGSGDVSKLARCWLVFSTVAGILVMSACESRRNHPVSYTYGPTLEALHWPTSGELIFGSPATLVFATATTAMTLTIHHYRQRDRRHQDVCIAGAVAAGVAGGWLYGLDGTSILLRVAPWCALLGMLMGGCSPTRERQDWGTDEIPVISEISKRAVSLA